MARRVPRRRTSATTPPPRATQSTPSARVAPLSLLSPPSLRPRGCHLGPARSRERERCCYVLRPAHHRVPPPPPGALRSHLHRADGRRVAAISRRPARSSPPAVTSSRRRLSQSGPATWHASRRRRPRGGSLSQDLRTGVAASI